MDNIEHLYKCYEILSDAGDKISEVSLNIKENEKHNFICISFCFFQHVSEYKDILKAVKGSSKEKRLASQFIGKFFKHFPDLSDTAIDAQLDLCEDDDMQVNIFLLFCWFLILTYNFLNNNNKFLQFSRRYAAKP